MTPKIATVTIGERIFQVPDTNCNGLCVIGADQELGVEAPNRLSVTGNTAVLHFNPETYHVSIGGVARKPDPCQPKIGPQERISRQLEITEGRTAVMTRRTGTYHLPIKVVIEF